MEMTLKDALGRKDLPKKAQIRVQVVRSTSENFYLIVDQETESSLDISKKPGLARYITDGQFVKILSPGMRTTSSSPASGNDIIFTAKSNTFISKTKAFKVI
jgi:hypothetical protein